MLTRIRTGLDWLRAPCALLDARLAKGGLTFRLDLPVMGRSLLTGDPALIAGIVRNKELIGGRGTQALRPVVGDHSLIVLEGARHERHRTLMLPHFFTGDMTAHDVLTRKWVARALEAQPPLSCFSGMKFTADITLNIIIEVLFGALGPARHEHAVGLVRKWLGSFTNPAILFLKPLQINLGERSAWGRFLNNRTALHRFIEDLLAKPDSGGVLGTMMRQRRAGTADVSDAELVSQMVTFLMFGHDTSAAAMGWFFHHILQDPRALADVRGEIDLCRTNASNALADPEQPDLEQPDPEQPDLEQPDLEQHVLLRSAIHESMRLSPVVVHLTRHAVAPTAVGDYQIAAGERVLPCMYLAQRNPAVFDQPDRFIARRFVNPKPEWRHSYFPFGLGNRLCAGMPFALRQMVLIASEMLGNCNFELANAAPAKPVRNMVLIVPSGGPLLRRLA
ncbi:cytochrome P450 [Massilia glaciei]|uniref:Cytochrome P450 n=1 Tax=Massilia glaciei TaxID=1524097 RepID=A0A2U2HIG2_9BURK|nr:cytochrome P450 [Massilia glaciei]PWF46123.1 cytochrome P450 [Massilia glaciei]